MKKLAVFAIIVLIFGTISPSLVDRAYGQSDPSILLRIAVQADKQIVNQLDRVYGDQIPNNLQILYDKGHRAVYSLDESLPNDIEKAKQDFLLAMNSFMQISRTISQSSEKVVVVTVSDKSNRHLTSEIDRLEKYVLTLKTISKKLDAKINFENIDDLLLKTRNQINNGTEIPSETIIQLKSSITSIEKDKIRAKRLYNTLDRIGLLAHVKVEDIINYGESLGTGVAVELNLKYDFLCTVLEAPFTSIADVALKRYKIFPTKLTFIDRNSPNETSIYDVGFELIIVAYIRPNCFFKNCCDSFRDLPDKFNNPTLSSYIVPSREIVYVLRSCVSPHKETIS